MPTGVYVRTEAHINSLKVPHIGSGIYIRTELHKKNIGLGHTKYKTIELICPICGITFTKKENIGKTCCSRKCTITNIWRNPTFRENTKKRIESKLVILSKDILYDLYYNKNISLKKTAKLLNVSESCIRNNFKMYNFIIRNNSESQIARFLNPLEREKTSIKSLENWAKPEYQKKQSDATTKLFNDPIIREKHKSGCKEAGNRPEKREELKQRALKNWQNPEYVKKNFKSQKKSPNNAEKLLDKIIQEILIDTYKFTGDGSMPIGTKKPDFTNIKGQMKLIELYGTGIHADPDKYQSDHILSRGRSAKQIWEEDFNRLQYLKSQGYEILIIWQKELRRDNIGKLKQKILEFNNIKN